VVDLKRRLPSETISPFYSDRTEHLDVLARKAARWCQDHAEEIKKADGPELLPPGIYNREGDNWRPLLAIAQVVGGGWLERTCKAVEQGHAAAEDESRITILLSDIRSTYADEEIDRIKSAALAEALAKIEGHPWAEYRRGKPISQNQLARLLKPLGIGPNVIRLGSETWRGYYLSQFAEAFERYLPQEGLSNLTA
jgi:putative DNA primase/helicase